MFEEIRYFFHDSNGRTLNGRTLAYAIDDQGLCHFFEDLNGNKVPLILMTVSYAAGINGACTSHKYVTNEPVKGGLRVKLVVKGEILYQYVSDKNNDKRIFYGDTHVSYTSSHAFRNIKGEKVPGNFLVQKKAKSKNIYCYVAEIDDKEVRVFSEYQYTTYVENLTIYLLHMRRSVKEACTHAPIHFAKGIVIDANYDLYYVNLLTDTYEKINKPVTSALQLVMGGSHYDGAYYTPLQLEHPLLTELLTKEQCIDLEIKPSKPPKKHKPIAPASASRIVPSCFNIKPEEAPAKRTKRRHQFWAPMEDFVSQCLNPDVPQNPGPV